MKNTAKHILESRRRLISQLPRMPLKKPAEEGGCGVVGFAANVPVSGRHIFRPSIQMHNRGNGKGGGIAAASLDPTQLGVDAETLRDDYILQIALLDSEAQDEVEQFGILPNLRVDHRVRLAPKVDYRELGLELRPPDIVRYFVRVREDALSEFAEANGMAKMPARAVEDEFIFQNTAKINHRFYASLGEQRAFVLSHARDLMIFKIVGYAEQVVQYYGLEDVHAQVWIAHQRYPTRGRVWHPGGAHPFIGMNEALVHNGDLANFHSIRDYLQQHNIRPMFLTDTEVAALNFDLLHRVYGYPLEYVIEAMAPTTELDFDQLPGEKRLIYRAIHARHMHGSPDGPWFFIIARSDPDNQRAQLLGITDTAMLRPQVFALQEGQVSIALVASEKQAIDATLESLSDDDPRFRRVADRYWNARGGSATDGGAFVFNIERSNGSSTLTTTDKFGRPIQAPAGESRIDLWNRPEAPDDAEALCEAMRQEASAGKTNGLPRRLMESMATWQVVELRWVIDQIKDLAKEPDEVRLWALDLLTLLNNRRYHCGRMKRSVVLQLMRQGIDDILDGVAPITENGPGCMRRLDHGTREALREPTGEESILVVDANGFEPEGEACDSTLAVQAYRFGWKRFIVYRLRGQRFHGCGLGPQTDDVRFDLYGSSGDYVASGIDGLEVHIHDNAQDQLGQIMKRGKLVVHGDVGQTFLYGAKGGEIYVLGNAAGRPLINAVGRPRSVINGVCLDFLAESFMAGDPHNGGGFVVLNGIQFDDRGRVLEQPTPYPGSNLFSLASGGAIFVRDPHRRVVDEQLNGGMFAELTHADWELILPYLQANERHFGIEIGRDLLTVDGIRRKPSEVYRKVQPATAGVLGQEAVPE